jgi:predicted PurR-regulated permease PerM
VDSKRVPTGPMQTPPLHNQGATTDSTDQLRRWPPVGYWARVAAVVVLVVLGFLLTWLLRSVVLVLVASFVLAIGLQPAIGWFEKRGMGRGWALATILAAGLIVMAGFAVVMVPFLAEQFTSLLAEIPSFVERLREAPGFLGSMFQSFDFDSWLAGTDGQPGAGFAALGLVSSVGGTLFNVVTVLAVTPYLAFRIPQLRVWVTRLLRPQHREDFLYVANGSTDLIANYLVGNLLISLISGLVAFASFQLLGIRFSLVLAAWVAFTDLIPVLGAILGVAGVAAVAAFQSPGVLIAAVAILLLYQLVENFVIAPRVMNRAVDLSPVAVIIAILIGGSLAGLVGALLALPVAAMIKIIVFELVVPERIDEVRREAAATGTQRSRRRRISRPLP